MVLIILVQSSKVEIWSGAGYLLASGGVGPTLTRTPKLSSLEMVVHKELIACFS